MKKLKEALPPYRQCSQCVNGWVVVEIQFRGQVRTEARRCECFRQWRREVNGMENVDAAAGRRREAQA